MILDQGSFPVVVVAMDGGWKVATIKDYFNNKPKRIRVKILGVLPAPNNKDEIRQTLAQARAMIDKQVQSWRSEAN